MGHLENVINKIKEKISDYKEYKKLDESEIEEYTKFKKITSQYESVDNEDGEIEDWYNDVS